MAYDTTLAHRVRKWLYQHTTLGIEEKEMFKGLTFMVDGKMCVSVSGNNLMVRFDPALQDTLPEENGFSPMLMKGKTYKGYGYVDAATITTNSRFSYWLQLCLDFNPRAKASKKK